MIDSLILNLEHRDHMTDDEKAHLRKLVTLERHFARGEDIVQERSRPKYSTLMLEGFSARYKLTQSGSRQITALHLPGDFVDLHAFPLRLMDHGIMAMSPCRVALVDHGYLTAITEGMPHLTRLFWLQTLIDGAMQRERIVAMGRKSAKSHLAHLFCELFVRLKVVKLTDGYSFNLPLTQQELSDVLGLSIVHLNKTLQTLRRDKVLTFEGEVVTILEWDRLSEIAEFDPTYLSLQIEPR